MARSFKRDYLGGATAPATLINPYKVSTLVNQVGHGFDVAEPVMQDDESNYQPAISDGSQTVMGVVAQVIDVDNFLFAQYGRFIVPAHGLTVGETYYSTDIDGGLSPYPPAIYSPESRPPYCCPALFVEDPNTLVVRPTSPHEMWDLFMLTGYIRTGRNEVVYIATKLPYAIEAIALHYSAASGDIEGTVEHTQDHLIEDAAFSPGDESIYFSTEGKAEIEKGDWIRIDFHNNVSALGIRWNLVCSRRYS